jgi:transcriptional regulator with XRE-family HTH domain
MKAIGERIKYLRTEVLGQTQEDFASALCISRSGLSMIENHQNLPGCFFLYILHTTLHVNLHWLMTGEGEPKVTETKPK